MMVRQDRLILANKIGVLKEKIVICKERLKGMKDKLVSFEKREEGDELDRKERGCEKFCSGVNAL